MGESIAHWDLGWGKRAGAQVAFAELARTIRFPRQPTAEEEPVNEGRAAAETISETQIMNADLTHVVERLEAFEERLGVTVEGVYATQTSGYIQINGELHPRDGSKLMQDVSLVADVYDEARRLIGRGDHWFRANKFLGFESFTLLVEAEGTVSKVRLYPKPL